MGDCVPVGALGPRGARRLVDDRREPFERVGEIVGVGALRSFGCNYGQSEKFQNQTAKAPPRNRSMGVHCIILFYSVMDGSLVLERGGTEAEWSVAARLACVAFSLWIHFSNLLLFLCCDAAIVAGIVCTSASYQFSDQAL